ncbi:hypothetical protein GH714_020412 [Hevea brasiliensis]|uniref:Uncharacterized protein n=1 Tax=Hevea brasiliensis TaxID=3981 RepID=A0A6A6K885_HEVBR|nr:hypothetical protein GH714_020412 [Hevea brasiliensis]
MHIVAFLYTLPDSASERVTKIFRVQFFTSSPLTCELSGLPVIHREKDEPTQANDRKKRKKSRKTSRDGHEGHGRRSLSTIQPKEDTESSKELERCSESNTSGQETGNSASSSTSSGLIAIREEQKLRPSFSPGRPSRQNRKMRTEAHPNAMRNIQNFTLLQASITDIINHNAGGAMECLVIVGLPEGSSSSILPVAGPLKL